MLLIGSAAVFSAKTHDVLANLAAKTARITQDPLTPMQRAASAARGNPLSGGPNEGDDYSWVTRPSEDTAAFAGAFSRLNDDRQATGSFGSEVKDFGLSIMGGATQGGAALLSIPDNLIFGGALKSSELSSRMRAGQENLTANTTNRRNEAYEALAEADSRELDRQEITGAERIYRDMGNTFGRLGENPDQITQGVANAGGSFLLGGAVSKGVGLGLRGAEAVLKNRAVTSLLSKYGDEIAGGIGMGAMEAGGAGLQASQAVLEMSHDELVSGSPFYTDYLARHGDTTEAREAAKQAVASGSANVAALVQAPAALLGGALTSKIAANPFSAGSLREALANVGKETLEEATQEGLGNLSSNIGVRTFADQNQVLEEGIGRGIVEGAVFGGLSTGGMQVPGTAARRGVERIVETAQAVYDRGEAINNRNRVDAIAKTAETVQAAVTPVAAIVPEPIEGIDQEADVAELTAMAPMIEELGANLRFNPETVVEMTPAKADIISQIDPEAGATVFDVMTMSAQKLEDKTLSPAEKLDYALLIKEMQDSVKPEDMATLLELKDMANPGGTVAKALTNLTDAQQAIASNDLYNKLMIGVLKDVPPVRVQDVEDISTPEGAKAARQATLQAILTPENIDPEVVERMLKHSEDGTGTFTPKETRALRTVASLTQALKAAQATASELGVKAPDNVRVATDVQSANYIESGKTGPSVRGHYQLINKLSDLGQMEDAKAAAIEFGNFAQHMANKAKAINTSFNGRENGKNPTVKFDTYSPKTGWKTNGNEVYAARFSNSSIPTAQQIGVDAEYVIDSYNMLVDNAPDLGLQKIEQVRLDPGLRMPVRQVIEAAKAQQEAEKRGEVKPAPKTEIATKPEPKPVVETKTAETATKNDYVAPETVTSEPKAPEPVTTTSQPIDKVVESIERIERSLAELRAERDRREDDLVNEPSVIVSDTAPQEVVEEVAEPEAKPEVIATEETTNVQTKKTPSVKEVFPNLVESTAGENLLVDGFVMDGQSRSRLVGENALSVGAIVSSLQSPDAFKETTGLPAYKLQPRVAEAYNSTLRAVLGPVLGKISERIKTGKDFARHRKGQPIPDGSNPMGIKNVGLRLMSLMVRQADGSLDLNDKVKAAGVLALADWLAQNSVANPPRDAETIARQLGVNISDVDAPVMSAFNGGITAGKAHLGLMSKLEQFLGIVPNQDTPLGLSSGMMLSYAGELLASAIESGLITPTPVTIENADGKAYFNFYSVNKKALGLVASNEDGPNFEGQTTLIQQIVTQDETVAGYDFKSSGKFSTKLQKGNAPASVEQQATQVRENAVPNTVNIPMLKIYRRLGVEGMVNLFGNGYILPTTLNKNDRLSKESQNLSVVAAFDALNGMVQLMEGLAGEDRALEEIQAFYEYQFSSVNRMQQQGAYGTQSSKITREVITPYGVTLDLSDKTSADYSMWRRGLAQALGIKIEILEDAVWDQKLTDKLSEASMVAALDLVKNADAVNPDDLVEGLKLAGIDSAVAFHATVAYAEYLTALENGTEGEHFTHVYVEADGKTDGPLNSMFYMRKGGFDADWVRAVARGGISFSKEPKSLPSIYNTDDPSKELGGDGYQVVAKEVALNMKGNAQDVINGGETKRDKDNIRQHYDDVIQVLQTLIGGLDFSEKNGVITIGRSQLKNPMTVTVYGSSATGIADKIAGELIGKFYEQISEANRLATEAGQPGAWRGFLFFEGNGFASDTAKDFVAAMGRLTSKVVVTPLKSGSFVADVKGGGMPALTGNAIDFTINQAATKALSEAIGKFYVAPMVRAIGKEMGTSIEGSQIIQRSTNMLSSIAKTAFIRMFSIELAKTGKAADGLSPKQLKAILAKVAFLFPYMEGDVVTVNVKGLKLDTPKAINPTTGKPTNAISASTLTNTISTQLQVAMPAIAGVAGGAYVNISYGDGRMIIQASPKLTGGRLHIFDGINVAIKNARKNGIAINETVLEALQTGTPFQDLQKTFNELTQTLNWDIFTPGEAREMFNNIVSENGKLEADADPVAMLKSSVWGQAAILDVAALEERARQNVLRRVHLSSDHMAALNAPASTAGQKGRLDFSKLNFDQVAKRLQRMYEKELAALQGEKPEVKDKPETISKAFRALPKDETGVRITDTDQLGKLLKQTDMPKDQWALIYRALLSLKNSKWNVVVGSKKAANAFLERENVPFSFGSKDYGLTLPDRRTVIVANGSVETLTHELIHAATYDKVEAYYDRPEVLDPATREAVRRLEALQTEWLQAVTLRKTDGQKDAVAPARAAIEGHLNAGRMASALNEFMAWNLTNQDLIKLNSKIKVESTLARITKEVVKTIKGMLGIPPSDMAWNIRFNSLIVLGAAPVPSLNVQAAERMLQHSSGSRSDLEPIFRKFGQLLVNADKGYEDTIGLRPSEFALKYAWDLVRQVQAQGFNLTDEEQQGFVLVAAAYRANQVIDPAANVKMDQYYRELLAQMSQQTMMDDPNSTDPDMAEIANKRMDLLKGAVELGQDVKGLSLLLPMFVALGATSREAQKVFSRIEVRDRKLAPKGTTFDSIVKAKAENSINALLNASYRLKPGQKVGEEVQNIVAALVKETSKEKATLIQALNTPGNLIRFANEKSADALAFSLGKVSDAMQYMIDEAQGTAFESTANGAGKVAQLGVQIMSKRTVEDATMRLTSMIDAADMPQELRAFVTELLGVNETNQDILVLVKQGRAMIDRVRQSYLKLMPQQIKNKFKKPLSTQQWADLHIGLGQTDLAVLMDQGFSSGAVIDLIGNQTEVSNQLKQKEADIRQMFGGEAAVIVKEINELTEMMATGRRLNGLVKRNALAIANRAGEGKVGNFTWTSPETRAIDGYASLLMLSRMRSELRKSLTELAQTERAGMENVLSLIGKARADEMERVPPRLMYNIVKGYMPVERMGSFKAVPADKVNDFTKAGYRVVGSRQAGAVENLHSKGRGLVYIATDLTAPSFKQGIMRTVRSTVFGLDAVSGASYDNPSAGLITSPTEVLAITRALKKDAKKDQLLSPLFNEQGQLYAYERLIDPREVDYALESQQNAAVSVGQWMGRQHEEVHAQILNNVLIERLTKMYEEGKGTSSLDEFVDLNELAVNDPIVADALRLMNDRDMTAITARMDGKFMVKKSLYEQIIGYRSVSIGDAWTGNTRASEENREAVANYLTGLLGPEAYRYLTKGEQAWTNLMGDARVAIVVKSMLVPGLNAMANFYQLMANGIGPVTIAQKSAEKLRETHLYAKNFLELQRLEVELAAAQGAKRPDFVRRIETEMQKIKDINQRLSIWPLIEVGEFSQVTEGLTQDDMEMSNGRVWDYVSKAADKLPTAVKTAGRYALVTKDTALFEALARTVSYTDFVAKAILYDHLTNKMKLSPKAAALRVTNEFVNYDLLGGRMRSRAEEMGLVWFWSFKLRSIKVAASLIRNNPLNTFLSSMVPGSMEAGTVMDDNGINLVLDGRFDNSLGFDNAWRAVGLNPVVQLLG